MVDVVKSLEVDESESADWGKNRSELEATDSIKMFDLEKSKQLEAKWRKGQRKKRQHHDSKGAEKGHTSKQADRKGRGARNRMGQEARVRCEAGKARAKIRTSTQILKLSLRGAVEIQAQHWVHKSGTQREAIVVRKLRGHWIDILWRNIFWELV